MTREKFCNIVTLQHCKLCNDNMEQRYTTFIVGGKYSGSRLNVLRGMRVPGEIMK